MNNYGTPPLTLVRGKGAEVWDADGRRYLDLLGGIAVNALGHAHPALVEAVTTPARARWATRRTSSSPTAARAGRAAAGAARRATRPGAVLQLRHRGQRGGVQDRPAHRPAERSSPAENAFHGRTMGALALTGQPAKRDPVRADDRPASRHIPFGDVDALRRRRRRPHRRGVPGADPRRGGAVIPPRRLPRRGPADHRRARRAPACSTRCRPASAAPAPGSRYQQAGITPDVITLAKGLGGGLPIGAVHRPRRGRRAAPARPARHHLRRQPGVLRGRAGGAVDTIEPRTAAGPRRAGRQAPRRRHRGPGPPAGRPASAAQGLLIGIAADRDPCRPGRGRRRPRRRAS